MKFHITKIPRYNILEIIPPMDMTTSYELKQELLDFIEKETQSLVLDLKNIDEVDSSAISLLVTLQKKVKSKGMGFYLIRVNQRIVGLLNLAFLADFFKIYKHQEDLP